MNYSVLRTRKRQGAFTLIELLITMAVLGVLMAIALPSLRSLIVSNRLSSNVNGFVGLINYARSEAIVRNQSVMICPKSNSGVSCANDALWGQYEIQVFVDCTGNDDRNVSVTTDCPSGDTLLKTWPALDTSGLEFALIRGSNVPAAGKIKFGAIGMSQTAHSFDIKAVGDATFEQTYGRSICISKPGRVRVTSMVTGACAGS